MVGPSEPLKRMKVRIDLIDERDPGGASVRGWRRSRRLRHPPPTARKTCTPLRVVAVRIRKNGRFARHSPQNPGLARIGTLRAGHLPVAIVPTGQLRDHRGHARLKAAFIRIRGPRQERHRKGQCVQVFITVFTRLGGGYARKECEGR